RLTAENLTQDHDFRQSRRLALTRPADANTSFRALPSGKQRAALRCTLDTVVHSGTKGDAPKRLPIASTMIRVKPYTSIAFLASGLAVASSSLRQPVVPRLADVYLPGEGPYHPYRIPSVIATPKGALLAFAEGRREGAGDAGDIDLVLKRSHDGGRSWTAMQVIGDNGPNTFGNPCPVVDARTNTIWLLITQNRGTDREKDIIAGTSEGGR